MSDFINLRKLGQEIHNYFCNFFKKDDYFFLSINDEVFATCIKNAGLDYNEVIKELKKIQSYYCSDSFVKITVAAFQVKLFFDSCGNSGDTFRQQLIEFYGSNIYEEWQKSLWEACSSFLNNQDQALRLMLDNSDNTYQNYTHLKFPFNQLFFISNQSYGYELAKICIDFNINKETPLNVIKSTLSKKRLLWECNNIKGFLKFEDSLKPENYIRIIAYSIFLYTRKADFDEIIKQIRSNSPSRVINNNYYFEIAKYSGEWILSIFSKETYDYNSYLNESNDNEQAYDAFRKSFLRDGQISQLFIYSSLSENSDDEYYRTISGYEDYEASNLPVVLVSSQEIKEKKFEINNFLNKNLFIYKFSSLLEGLKYIKKSEIEEEIFQQVSKYSFFKGGIKLANGKWLLGCEPKIPDNCDLVFGKEAAIYRTQINGEDITIEIIGKNEEANIRIDEETIGWGIYNLPELNGFEIKISNERNYIKNNREVNKYNNDNYSVKAYHNGDKIEIVEIQCGINWYKMTNSYVSDLKEKISKLKIKTKQSMNVGYIYEATLYIKTGIISIENEIEKPYEEKKQGFLYTSTTRKIRKSSFSYHDYNKERNIGIYALNLNEGNFFIETPEEEIFANAIGYKACYLSLKLDYNFFSDSNQQEKIKNIILNYSRLADNNNSKPYFVDLKFYRSPESELTPLNLLNKIVGSQQLSENLFWFFTEIPYYTIKDPDFHNKQEQLLRWIDYAGFVSWQEVNRKCIGLLEADSEDIRKQYGKNPIYRLFNPLIVNGKVEVCKLEEKIHIIDNNDTTNTTYGFSLAKETRLDNEKDCEKKAFEILSQTPNLHEYVSNTWTKEPISNIKERVYKRPITGKILHPVNFSRSMTEEGALIFKNENNKSPHVPYLFAVLDEKNCKYIIKTIPTNTQFDSLSYAYCIIEARKNALFEYSKMEKVLKCKKNIYYTIIPFIIQRALLLFNPEQLKDKDIYLPYRNYKSFNKIPYKAVELLQEIFGEKAIEIKE
ncbi:MAG: hypothetical protein K6C97_00760 [Treponema sp.]|nr:hypothetical protein [Treponema sp.]